MDDKIRVLRYTADYSDAIKDGNAYIKSLGRLEGSIQELRQANRDLAKENRNLSKLGKSASDEERLRWTRNNELIAKNKAELKSLGVQQRSLKFQS